MFIGYFTTVFSFIDNAMHLCSWPHCNRRTINSFIMMMMMMMMMANKCEDIVNLHGGRTRRDIVSPREQLVSFKLLCNV